MRALLVSLSVAALLAAGCASRQSDSLYRPVDTTVSYPSTAPLGDETEQDREQLEHAQRVREESLREQRENNETEDDNDD